MELNTKRLVDRLGEDLDDYDIHTQRDALTFLLDQVDEIIKVDDEEALGL
jgi:hypothetical protein